MSNLYDFENTDDLNDELAARLAPRTRTVQEPELVADIVDVVAGAPHALTLAQIIAVLSRKGFAIPGEPTVRKYVNTAVADGRIEKPTRQTYFVAAEADSGEADPLAI